MNPVAVQVIQSYRKNRIIQIKILVSFLEVWFVLTLSWVSAKNVLAVGLKDKIVASVIAKRLCLAKHHEIKNQGSQNACRNLAEKSRFLTFFL